MEARCLHLDCGLGKPQAPMKFMQTLFDSAQIGSRVLGLCRMDFGING